MSEPAPVDPVFESTFKKLTTFVSKDRRWPVTSSTDGAERRLAMWVQEHRRRFHMGALRPERIERMNAVPGWTWGTAWSPIPYPSDREREDAN